MKVVIAIDSFKGSLSSLQAGTCGRAPGFIRVDPEGGDGCAPAGRWR